MKSVAIFLALVFLTGFQAAVLNEEPPPSVLEPNQNLLEQMKEHVGRVSTQVTNRINRGVEVIKQHTSDLANHLLKLKPMNRKFISVVKDVQQVGQNAFSQSKEAVNNQYKKMKDMLEEMMKHPTTVALHEETVKPLVKFMNWMGDQSPTTMYNMMRKTVTSLTHPAP